MAYKLLYNDELLFDPYSDNIVTDAQLTSKYNNPDYFDFTVPITNDLYDKLSERSGSVKLFYDNEKIFDGIITSIDIDMDGNKSIKCSGPLDYLNDTLVRPYSTKSGESQTQAPDTVSGIFQWYVDQHNQHTMDPKKNFSVGINQGAMLSENNAFSRKSDSLPTTWDEIKNAILEDHGGFIFVEYSGDSNILNLYGDIHESNAQIIDFGVNITDFSKVTDTADQYTAIRPSGYTPEAPKDDQNKKMYPITISDLPDNPFDSDLVKKGDIIYSASAVKRYGYKEYAYSNNDITDTNNLLKSAAVILKTLISPAETITVKAVDLALYMNGYKHLRVGQAVRIRSKLHSTDEYMMVNSIVLDINDPSNTEYEFGIPYDTLTGQQSSYLKNLNSSINSTIDSVAGLDQVSKDTAKKAEDAKNTANVAKDTADTAQNTANNASSKADKAQTTANTANTTANKAQTTATEAKTTADSANKAAEELKKKTAEIDKQVEAASNAANAASAKADQVRTDLQKQVDANKAAASAASAKADQVRTDLTNQVQNVKSEMDTAVEAAQTSANKAQSAADAAQKAADKANASTVDLDKSIKAVDAKAIAAKQAAAEAQSKAENVASDLDSANAVIEQHTTELGELTTKVSNAVKKSDSALSVSTEAKQTATEASTTATSAYRDSQTALTQSTTATQTATAAKTTAESASKTASDSLKQSSAAVQTANQISTTLRTEYQTKADADKLYATQSSLKQTSDSITASVSKTYATKDALSALQNVADNAIESWRGTGVPTLENKPASDWTTNADKKKHSGDLYYDKSTGKAYRFGSDDGVTYTWELNQDTDVTKALEDAANAQTSANNAQASATAANTAAGKAQSTANTAVSNAATAKNAADAAQSSANKAQGDVDKLKIDIPETYATKSSLSQTAESITANVESVKTTANSAVTAASKAQQTADSISVNLTKNYQTKSQADTLYATKASLKATSDSISAEVTKAQGTADGAVTAASKAQQTADAVTLNLSKNYNTKDQNDALYATQTSLKATSDSLSANITANAKTAQSAVDKATSLEANLNGFKTTVSQTYTTKTDFNNLTVGGTNLIPDSKELLKGDFSYSFLTRNKVSNTIPGFSGFYFRGNSGVNSTKDSCSWTIHNCRPGDRFTFSFYCGAYQTNKIRTYFYGPSGYMGAKVIASIDHPSGYGAGTYSDGNCDHNLSASNGNGKFIWVTYECDPNYKGSVTDKYILIRTDPSVIGSNIWIAKPKMERGTKPTDWSPAPEDLQPAGDYATNSSLTQTANSIKAEVTEVSKTANSAMSKATTVEQTANGLSSKITEQAKTLNATVKTANEAKSTADSNKATISQTANLVDAALAGDNLITDGGFESTEWWKGLKNPFRISIGSFYHGKHVLVCDAATGDNRCPLTHEKGIAGSATTIPVTKGRTYRLSGYCAWYLSVPSNVNPSSEKLRLAKPDGSFITEAPCSKLTSWSETHVDWKCPDDGSITSVRIEVMHQTNGTIMWDDVAFRDITEAAATSNRVSSVEQNLNGFKTTVAETYQTKDGMSDYATNSSLTQTANSIKAEVTEVSKTANSAMSKATTVEQTANGLSSKITEQAKTLNATVKTANEAKSTADSNKATISQVSTTASSALTKASSVEQNLNGFKTTVSQTYGRGSNLWVNPTFDADKPQITSRVSNVTAPNGSGVNLLATRDHHNNDTSFPVVPGHKYVITAHVKRIKGNVPLNAGIWYTALTAGHAYDTYTATESTSVLSDGWISATWRFSCPDGKSRGCVFFQIEQSASNGSTQWYISNVTCVDVTGLQPAGDYSTKSYVDQTAKSVALGVVQNYKGADGSGLATKSDITAAKDSISSTVASTYATKSGVTQEISSKITQNNNSLDVKFATKTENQKAQNAANTANSNATNAQSRVGNIEDCITLTSNGVRAGKRSNGVFSGVSALVNTEGSFDLLDANGNRLTRIDRHTFYVTGDNGVGSGYITLSQDGINITVTPGSDTKQTYHIKVGKDGISLTSPDGTHMNCSAATGMDLETRRWGKLALGPSGMQYTDGNDCGFKLGVSGWSIKWPGNHLLATGPTAGKLYIDGHEIVTR